MATEWTKEQKQVIEERGGNLLVSAAAGSGKTAVLVERIISRITDKEKPVDIDTLLIVTFTNAAAAEMRERIGAAIEEKVLEEPDSIHLQRQQTLIHTAPITTIDSFCMRVVREHFDRIDLDPAFHIGEEGEQKLLKRDMAQKLLESYYEEGREDFLEFVESYSPGKSDEGLEDIILRLYDFSMSYPDPERWLEECLLPYQLEKKEDLENSNAMSFLLDYIHKIVKGCISQNERAISLAREEGGPYMYLEALDSDRELLEAFEKVNSYQELFGLFGSLKFAKLSAKRDSQVSQEKRDKVKAVRDQIKDNIKSIGEQFFFQSMEAMAEDIASMRKSMEMLVELVSEYKKRFTAVKRDKNMIDFHDVEHFALEILTGLNEEGERVPTKVADEYSERFEEIMIDEYQDSNFVQEAILTSVSRVRFGKPNVFMVGDVKQSIYKFRLARPELFMDKYNSYQEEGPYMRIDLHRNFRSREQVLLSVNEVFFRIMTKELGKITYDEREALYPGAVFPEDSEEGEEDKRTELWLIERDAGETNEKEAEYTAMELEARVIAKRIAALTKEGSGMRVFDKKQNGYRTARLSDIVILLRTVQGWADTFVEVLAEEGIPAFAQSQTGYFTALEVQTVLGMLRIIDNPDQDIPLAGVLRSPMAGMSSRELAEIRLLCPKASLYAAVKAAAGEAQDETGERLKEFLEMLGRFRDMAAYMPLHELIRTILKETGYGDYAAAMPAGKKRKMNLEMLVEKAASYESTSYQGVFHFIRYIESLQKYDVDYGEASPIGENENTVRIVSIHKSKGLEFPIVFAAGMGKRFNQQDASDSIVLHPDLGIAGDYVDYEKRLKSPSLYKKILAKNIRLENLGEELRVLYVALTRAKEKLILTGSVKGLPKAMEKWELEKVEKGSLSYSWLSSAGTYLDWLAPACPDSVRILTTNPREAVDAEMGRQVKEQEKRSILLHWDESRVYEEEIRQGLAAQFSYQYPYLKELSLHGKTSVSELKRRSQQLELEEEGDAELLIPAEEPVLPDFLKEEKELSGTGRGTAYHKVMEEISFLEDWNVDKLKEFFSRLESQGKISKEAKRVLSPWKIMSFLHSPLASRMALAQKQGRLLREQQFVAGLKACELYDGTDSEELIILQGIMDAYFEEDGELVLVDYKTDWADKDSEDALLSRYGTQFSYYRKTLEQMTGKRVKESILYSFSLEKEIAVYGMKGGKLCKV